MNFCIFLEPTRSDMPSAPTEEEMGVVRRHFEYLQKLDALGRIVLVGRTNEPPYIGIAVLRAESREDAVQMLEDDPAIIAGVFKGRVQEFHIAIPESD